jgi:hypothetical protein
LSPRAIALSVTAPAARISSMIGARSSARALAFAARTAALVALPCAA